MSELNGADIYGTASERSRKVLLTLVDVGLLAGLCLVGLYNYLLFHTLAELLTAIVAGAAFVIFWNTRRFLSDGFYALLGMGYLAAGSLDIIHALSFNGMGVFPGRGPNLPTELWIAARYIQSLSILGAVLFLGRRLKPELVFAGYAATVAAVLLVIFRWDIFPDCYMEGSGLTPFKRTSEYAICGIVAASIAVLAMRRQRLDRHVFRLFMASLAVTVASELAFTAYIGVYDVVNYAGHVLKIVAFYLVYKALIGAGLTRPLGVLFRDLKRHQDELQQWGEMLEDRVATRTLELAQSEAALRQSEQRFRRLFETAPDGVIIADSEGRIELVNLQVEEMFGYPAGALIGERIEILVPKDQRAAHVAYREDYQRSPRTRPMGSGLDLTGRRADGALVPVEIMLSPLETPEGLRVMALIRNVTERKRLEAALRQSERLAAIGQMMTGLSHESRNALQRSLACLEMLGKRIKDLPAAVELLSEARKAQQDLLKVYEEVRSYAAPMRLERQTVDVRDVWCGAWEKLAALRDGRDATLNDHTDGVDRVCSVDVFRLEQVFRNLLENALAACSDPVHIEITCSDAELDELPALLITLRDNGPGLDPEQAERIFEPFYTTKTKGTGLGMPLVRRVVESHGGHVDVDPGPGRGLEVRITVPKGEEE